MSINLQKLGTLRDRLFASDPKGGALLLVYPPEDELIFLSGYDEIIKELQVKGVSHNILNFRTLVFEVLESKGLLQKAFQLDAAGSRDIRQNLAGMIQREVLNRLMAAAKQAHDAVICCFHTASLFPWISYSSLLEETENKIQNTLHAHLQSENHIAISPL